MRPRCVARDPAEVGQARRFATAKRLLESQSADHDKLTNFIYDENLFTMVADHKKLGGDLRDFLLR